MGAEIFNARITNNTQNIKLVVVDGNHWGRFLVVPPGYCSTTFVDSIDAFGAYTNGAETGVSYDGKVSTWWKISDGTIATVDDSNGVQLSADGYFPFFGPKPSTASAWGFDPSKVNGLSDSSSSDGGSSDSQ